MDREKVWRTRGGGGPPAGSGQYGGVGHDYRRDDDRSVPVDEARVNQMLAERMQACNPPPRPSATLQPARR